MFSTKASCHGCKEIILIFATQTQVDQISPSSLLKYFKGELTDYSSFGEKIFNDGPLA